MSYYLPPGAPPPAGGIPSDTGGGPIGGNVQGRRRRGGGNNPYNYQNFSKFTQGIQATPTAYESDVLGGKYLDVKNNPYVQGYTKALGNDFNEQFQRGLSEVSSPFLSGSTLGQTGMHAATRQNFSNEAYEDYNDALNKSYFDVYNRERGLQDSTNQTVSGRTGQLVGAASSAYGADQGVRSTRIQADATLQQARMAQQLGYDELAADMMFKYEQMNQQANEMERLIAMGYGDLVGSIMGGFGEQSGTESTQGPRQSGSSGFFQGALGGALGGAGIGNMFGGGGSSVNPAAWNYFAPWRGNP